MVMEPHRYFGWIVKMPMTTWNDYNMSDVSERGRGDPMRDRASGPLSVTRDASAAPEGGIPSAVLLQGRREIVILHAGARYRLRVTANDKLILTK